MSIKVSRILHAGYVFDCQNIQIAFDPIFETPFSVNCHAYPAISFDREKIKNLNFSAVFISHYHDDHCSLESLNLINRKTPLFIYCIFDELIDLIRSMGFTEVSTLKINKPVSIGPFQITARRALDADVDCLLQIQVEKYNILNVVDSWIDNDTLNLLKKMNPWDLLIWPMQTMRELEVLSPNRASPATLSLPEEWVEQIQKLQPRALIPSSCQFIFENWSWYNQKFFPISYKTFQEEIEQISPQTQIVRLDPSESLFIEKETLKTATSLDWIQILEEKNVDYEFDAQSAPSTTAEIAKRLKKLSAKESQIVFDYCVSGLMQRYSSLPLSEEPFFQKTLIWQLSVFDDKGIVQNFYYRINKASIELLQKSEEPVSWHTEIPACKLFSALEEGESLTSIYLRINDRFFDELIEKQLANVDLLEDPLVRCLYTGLFASYQKAQLKRIKSLSVTF
jgi:hypothetical protein